MSKWIKVEDEMPPSGKEVLVVYKTDYGHTIMVVGWHLERWAEESTLDDEWNEYNPEVDEYFLKEGWYEQIENWGDWSSVAVVEGIVTHWMELPQSPYDEVVS